MFFFFIYRPDNYNYSRNAVIFTVQNVIMFITGVAGFMFKDSENCTSLTYYNASMAMSGFGAFSSFLVIMFVCVYAVKYKIDGELFCYRKVRPVNNLDETEMALNQ